jgi:serine phosphatase RsbU (regulator of sigma subunit)
VVTERLVCLELSGGNQHAVYEAELPGLNGWVSSRPLRPSANGGDLHYLSVCSGGVVSRVALADVAGHGEIVSAAAGRLRDALRLHADSWDQTVLIQLLNDTFLSDAEGIEYATAFVLSYYGHSGKLLFTNAGHPPPLWYRKAAGEWVFMEETLIDPAAALTRELIDLPIGLIPGTAYTQTAVNLEMGDLILLYTDGVIESRDESGCQLGMEGLLAMAPDFPADSAASAGQALVSAVEEFRGDRPCEDDETIVALQRSPELG